MNLPEPERLDSRAVGRILARSVRSADGRLLQPPGTRLSAGLIDGLLAQGISSASFLPEPAALQPVSKQAPPHPLDQARLAHLFRHSLRAGQINPLQDLLQRYRGGAT